MISDKKMTSSVASLRKSIFIQPPKVVTYQTEKIESVMVLWFLMRHMNRKNALEHKTVTRGRKIDMLNSFTI